LAPGELNAGASSLPARRSSGIVVISIVMIECSR
jgi:hypothetical protein